MQNCLRINFLWKNLKF